ncbi:hypothetical protein GCM10010412_083440 [Nonomuraea recticatena]|uniref:Uncharacterized protein n=1 Tax=Nonomuraea recticatena TaxID=46178 RepID=A0ABP6FHL9_9ACTN
MVQDPRLPARQAMTLHHARLMFADRHPHAGGPAYLENEQGFEVELVGGVRA